MTMPDFVRIEIQRMPNNRVESARIACPTRKSLRALLAAHAER